VPGPALHLRSKMYTYSAPEGVEKASCFFILWIASHSHRAVGAEKARALWLHEWKLNACDASKWSCWLCTTWLDFTGMRLFHYAAFSNWRALYYCRKGPLHHLISAPQLCTHGCAAGEWRAPHIWTLRREQNINILLAISLLLFKHAHIWMFLF
jgi:hypothetical protein